LYVGSLEEALKWASGQDITVEETQCKARGDPCCQFTIGAAA
jgi:predicted hydrocarbon binding protein